MSRSSERCRFGFRQGGREAVARALWLGVLAVLSVGCDEDETVLLPPPLVPHSTLDAGVPPGAPLDGGQESDAGQVTDAGVDAGVVAGYVDPLSAPLRPTFSSSDELLGAAYCGACHAQHYAEWQAADHSQSMRDPVYQAAIAHQRDAVGVGSDRFCTQCHSPLGNRSGAIVAGFDFSDLPDFVLQGVSCETCHRIESVERPYNAGHRLSDEPILRGPLLDAQAPHLTAGAALFDQSELCASCHDVRAPGGLVLESPYAEWVGSEAQASGQSCQSCHMPTYRGQAAPGAPTRDNLHRHRFVGIAPPLSLDLSGEALETAWAESLGLLQDSVSLSAAALPASGGTQEITVTATNNIGGHDFPTGSNFNRQVWVALEVHDAAGALLFQSGQVDAAGDLHDDLHAQAGSDPQLWTLHTILRTATGARTLLLWETASTDRQSLAPGAARTHSYSFAVDGATAYPLEVTAVLRFRAYSPRLLRALGLDALNGRLRTLEVASTQISVPSL